ncbi:hypothetical protein FRC19_008728 [Serendipita sp. 401]|nr:hypothetical protein FRC19_008728 [Serendipita sp. 401]KAG9047199.1 hypothetical protein FS842_000704 [Serendipita sp. 407]
MDTDFEVGEQLSKELIDEKAEKKEVLNLLMATLKGVDLSPLINYLVRNEMTVPANSVPSTSQSHNPSSTPDQMLSDSSDEATQGVKMMVDVHKLRTLREQQDLRAQLSEGLTLLDTTNALKLSESNSLEGLESSIKHSQSIMDDILERLKTSVIDLAVYCNEESLPEPGGGEKILNTFQILLTAFETYLKRYVQALEMHTALSQKELSLSLVLSSKISKPAAKPVPRSAPGKRPSSPPEAQPAAKRRKGKKR